MKFPLFQEEFQESKRDTKQELETCDLQNDSAELTSNHKEILKGQKKYLLQLLSDSSSTNTFNIDVPSPEIKLYI